MPPAGAAPPADAGAAAGAALSGALPEAAASTSFLTTRPCGPVPKIAESSMPASFASRLASGEAKTRAPVLAGAGAAALGGGATTAEPEATAAAGAGAALGASAGCAAGAGAGALTSAALSPSVSSTAITALTFTFSVPSATMILPILPSSTASTSIVALSVSISAMTSPEETLSPSLTCHLASLPSSIVGESAGMVMLMLMVKPSLADIFVPEFRMLLDEVRHHVLA